MLKTLIRLVIALLTGAVATHAYWYKVNRRLQATHSRNLDDCFNRTYDQAYSTGFKHGVDAEKIVHARTSKRY